jgi:hypothetical protein
MTRSNVVPVILFTAILSIAGLGAQGVPGGGAGVQMPDPNQMSGIPLPVGDLPLGTIVVRVIRGSLANAVVNQPVELMGEVGDPRKSSTNETGRAEFAGLTPGAHVKAVTTVDGERLESREFTVPSTGGIRVMLVASDARAKRKAEAGVVVLGDQSRFVFEIGDDALSVFNLVQILNKAEMPVEPAQPLVFELPGGAGQASMLDGSSPQATAAGRQVTVKGPFPPGTTQVQFAYTMPYSGGDLTIEQRLPAALMRLTVLAQKVGPMQLASPQLTQHREMTAEGQTYIVAQGGALNAGDVVTFGFTGLPHHATWPRNLALTLAIVILAAGAWAGRRSGRLGGNENVRRRKLTARRERLFAELTAIEEQHRDGVVDDGLYAARRRELIAALERVYAELDDEAAV